MADEAGAGSKRWHVTISYKASVYPAASAHIEELSELHDLIERGPDWNLIQSIKVTLHRKDVRAA